MPTMIFDSGAHPERYLSLSRKRERERENERKREREIEIEGGLGTRDRKSAMDRQARRPGSETWDDRIDRSERFREETEGNECAVFRPLSESCR